MRLLVSLCCLLVLMAACSDDEASNIRPAVPGDPLPSPALELPATYLSSVDLEQISTHGTLRLIAPRFDGADSLPRDGFSVLAYQHLAEQFSRSLNLDVEWVFVDGFDKLIPALQRGAGDIVVTNMTVTKAREDLVRFTRPIAQVSEVVITRKGNEVGDVDQLAKQTITVPQGTAYLETLRQFESLSNLNIVASSSSDSDLLKGLASGDYQATIIDSDISRKLLPVYPGLIENFAIRKNRPIAWALRKNNPQLLRSLNQFLVSHHVKETSNQLELRDWQTIQSSGRLRMLTLNNPASYFMWRGELMGFDYELMRDFADKHDLHLRVIIKDDIPALFRALKNGEGDIIAASLTKSAHRETDGVRFTEPYLKVSEQVIGRKDGPKILSLAELGSRNVGVNPSTIFYRRLKSMQVGEENLKIIDNVTTEELIALMANGDFDFTLADSHLVAIEKSYHQNVTVNFNLMEESPIAWGIRSDQNQLNEKLNDYIKKQYRGLFYNVVFNKYFKNERKIKRYQEGRVTEGEELSPYDNVVKNYADRYGMDWRLLVAQMYQESKFDPKAKSFAGAQGLMQVMPRTAKEFGFSDFSDPENGIAAGVIYMSWLEERFPGELDFQERIYFTLAAYNAGTGHVRDARNLAERLGLNPNKWFGHVEKAMLKLSNPQYYKKARFGYVRGSEPVTYVRKIRNRYLGYLGH